MGPVTEQSEHLSSAQIENYGNRTSGAGPETAQRDEPQRLDHQSSDDQSMNDQRVEAHLADCPSCRNRVLDFHRHRFAMLSGPAPDAKPTDSALADSKFANPKYPADPQVRTAATPECPSDDALRQLAAGLTPDDVAAKLTQHAATCNHCGPLLRTYTEIFSDDFTPEEQAALANLQSAIRRMAEKHCPTNAGTRVQAQPVPPVPPKSAVPTRLDSQARRKVLRRKTSLDSSRPQTLLLEVGPCPRHRRRRRRSRLQHLVHPARHPGKSREAPGPGIHGTAADGNEMAQSSMGAYTDDPWS